MSLHLSPGAWLAIGCILGVLLVLNLGLFGAFWRRKPKDKAESPPSFKPSFREPWRSEERNIQELSKLVGNLGNDRPGQSPPDVEKNKIDPE